MRINVLSGTLATATVISLLLSIMSLSAARQGSMLALAAGGAQDPDVKHVIAGFTSGERRLRAALDHYGYKCDILVQTLKDGKVTGEFHRVSEMVMGRDGQIGERIISFPESSLKAVTVTQQDLESFSLRNQFPLESADASKYGFVYAGKEQVGNSVTYAFDVRPVGTVSGERLFEGRIWVRAEDGTIIKQRGKLEEQKSRQRFPMMEVSRTPVEGGYLFPSSATADEDLVFRNGRTVHLRIEIRYSEYVKLQ